VLRDDQLNGQVWGYERPRSDIVDVHVGYLRRKLGKDLTYEASAAAAGHDRARYWRVQCQTTVR
jgi:hypothetical protein